MVVKFFINIVVLCIFFMQFSRSVKAVELDSPRFWPVQSIDTMKYSRDPSREFLGKLDEIAPTIDFQIRQIADTGATHVAIATPYDAEFLPILKIWVSAARRNNIKVWFRGNWSGWEGWFGYPKISREEHLAKTKAFIIAHPELFEDGDIFTSCPECENGGPGDPRMHTDSAGFTQFMMDEHVIVEAAFSEISKDVTTNFYSSNGDVVRLIMTPEVTKKLGGVITVDHYVGDANRLARELIEYGNASKGDVVLGEFGAPIPDLHGQMSEMEQANWLDQLLSQLVLQPNLIGMNYWTNIGGSTALWKDDGTPKLAVETLKKYYSPQFVEVKVQTPNKQPLPDVKVEVFRRIYRTNTQGKVKIPFVQESEEVLFSKEGFLSTQSDVTQLLSNTTLTLPSESNAFIPSLMERLKWFFRSTFPFLY